MTRYSSSRSRSRSRHGGGSDDDGFRVHVADLSVDCSQKELDRAFQKFGDTFEIWLARNPPCFAFVVYKHKDDAEEAIREMNGQVLAGSRIRCSWAKPRIKGGRGGASSSSRVPRDPNLRCFRCGDRGHFARDCTGSGSRRSRRYSDEDDDRRRRRRSRSNSRHRKRSRSHSRSSRSTRRRRSRSRSRDDRRRRNRSSHSRSRSNSRHRNKRSRSRSRRRSRSPADRNGKSHHNEVKETVKENEVAGTAGAETNNGNKSPGSESGQEHHEQEEEFDMNADDAGNKYDPTEQVDDEDENQETENNGEEN